jgi:GNAT superfamily N-acetyltransferase
MTTLDLPPGYYELPRGRLANVVTCLEMLEKPALRAAPAGHDFRLDRLGAADTGRFRTLFADVGRDLMWFSRLIMPAEKLAGIIGNPAVESSALVSGGRDIGLLELDFREEGQCELSFFGLSPQAIGKGAGRWLMNEALNRAWQRPIRRLWVHTCTYDSPEALPFYRRSGFNPYATMIEVHDDPRQTGHLPETASPQVPLLRPKT